MKITTKILSLLLVLALSLSMLFSCGKEDDNKKTDDTSSSDNNPDGNGGEGGGDDSGNDGSGNEGSTDDDSGLPPVGSQLTSPKLTVSGNTVSWNAIAGATGYQISVNGNKTSLEADQLSYTVYESCTISVRALGDGSKYFSSNWSTSVAINITLKALDTPTISIVDGYAVWTEVENATGYEIEVLGVYTKLDVTVLSYQLSLGESIRVRAIGDETTFASSDWSAKVSLAGEVHSHTDVDNDNFCDSCYENVIVVVDLYAINDLHGKFCDTDKQPGVDELGTYLNNAKATDDHCIFLSSGDMWQGSAESNLTGGFILTEWMNEMGFVSMTLGNHEFDWGQEKIKNNLAIADFPFLAINIYDNSTGERVDYCEPSVIVDLGDVQVGIIGAIGNC